MKTNNPFGALGQLPNNFGSSLALIANGLGMMGGAPSNTGLINAGRAMDRDAQERAGQQRFAQLMRDPKVVGSLPKNIQAILPFMTRQAAGDIVAQYQARTARDAREAAAEEERSRQYDQDYQLRRDQFKLAEQNASRQRANQYEIRAEAAQRFGLRPGTQEFNDYVLGRKRQTSQQNTYKDLNQRNSAEAGLRKEATKELAPFVEIKQFNEQIQASKDTGPDTLSLVFGFMKMLDPQSVVRGSEVEASKSAGPAARMLSDAWNRFVRGGMRPELAAQFKKVSERVYKQYERRARKQYEFYKGIAKKRDMDFSNIVRGSIFDKTQNSQQNSNDPVGIR